MSKVEYSQLAPGLRVSKVLTGLWQIADLERHGKPLDPVATAQHLWNYFNAGLTTFDMADHYGSAELITGHFRQQLSSPEEVQLFTKWVPEPGDTSREKVRQAVERALQRMQMECLDLMQYHAWNYADPRWLDELYWLQELREEGLIRHIGLTNFDTAHLRLVLHSGIKVVSNQVCYSLLDQRAAGEMTKLCLAHNVNLLAFGTLAGGLLSEKWLDQADRAIEHMETWSQMKYRRFIEVAGGWQKFQPLLRVIQIVAKKHGVSIANVASRYIMEQPAVGGIIIGASLGKSEYIERNLALFDFQLDREDHQRIATSLETLSPIPGDCGDEYRKPPFLTASGDLSHHIEKLPAPYPVTQMNNNRSKALSGTVWEDQAGFSRAVRINDRILVSGSTATHGTKAIGGNDPAAQMHFVIDKIEGAVQSLGGQLEDVVRTRIFIQNMDDWEPIARAHGQRFKDIQPANTMIRADIIGEEYLVEMEAEAILPSAS